MPTGYTPIYRISRGGVDITNKFNDRCVMIRVDFSSGDGDDDKCFISLDDRDWAIAAPNLGETISISLGYKEVGLADMGEYTIEEVTYSLIPKTITLAGTASGAFQALRSPVTENYDKKTLGEIYQDLAKKSGIQAVIHPDLQGKILNYKNVITSPYMAFQELARQYNAVAKVAGGKLLVTPRGGGQSASGQAIQTLVLGPAHFGTCAVKHTNRSDYGSVKAAYFDREKNQRAFVQEQSPLGGDQAGLNPFIPNRLFNSREEAEAAAKAQMSAILRSRGNADITLAKGDPWIRDQQKILIRETRPGMNGSYVIELVSHTYLPEQGIGTAIKARPPDDGGDFEGLYEQATSPEQLRSLFIPTTPGQLLGEALRDNSLPNFGFALP